MNFLHTKKFKHGSISVAITVVIIAAVILLNVLFTALSQTYLWYIDMTPEPRFTLSDEAKAILHGTDTQAGLNKDQQVTIIFCDDKDVWSQGETLLSQVWTTAYEMHLEFPDNIIIDYKDIYTNPTSVSEYKTRTGKNIDQQSVIITSGEEVRVYNLEEFYQLDENQNVVGYDGEQLFVSSLLSVTRAQAPVLCITTNHEETYDEELVKLFDQIGFDVQTINLMKDPIPADCRVILISNPQGDFHEKDSMSDVSEIDKLDDFLAGNNSLIVLFNKDTPNDLVNLDAFLAGWGIAVARTDNGDNYVIRDLENSLTTNGYTNKAVYETSENSTGASITKPLREQENPKAVYFPNSTALRFSSSYKETVFEDYRSASSTANGLNRVCYNVFVSSSEATAIVKEKEVAKATSVPFSYMMLSCQSTVDDATGTISHSFVLASASTDFASAAALDARFGNRSVLAYACNTMGSLVVPVSLDCKYYASMEITTMTTSDANQYTIVLAVIPAVVAIAAGIYVMIRRKYA